MSDILQSREEKAAGRRRNGRAGKEEKAEEGRGSMRKRELRRHSTNLEIGRVGEGGKGGRGKIKEEEKTVGEEGMMNRRERK